MRLPAERLPSVIQQRRLWRRRARALQNALHTAERQRTAEAARAAVLRTLRFICMVRASAEQKPFIKTIYSIGRSTISR